MQEITHGRDARSVRPSALKEVAKRNAQVRTFEKDAAVETREFRKLQLARFTEAVQEKGISKNFQDEEQRNYNAAIANVYAAEAAIQKADAEVLEKESALHVALSDIELKKSLAEAAGVTATGPPPCAFAHVRAPFDGIITERSVQPGMLVQNASAGRPERSLKSAHRRGDAGHEGAAGSPLCDDRHGGRRPHRPVARRADTRQGDAPVRRPF